MRESHLETERIANSNESADRRNTDLAKHLAVGFTDKVTGGDPKASHAVAEAVEGYTVRHPVPRGGRSKIEWLAGALAAMTVALQGCDDSPREDMMHRTRAELRDLQNSDHGPTSAEMEIRIRRDMASLQTAIDRVPMQALATRIMQAHRFELDPARVGMNGGVEAISRRIFTEMAVTSTAEVDRLIAAGDLWIPDLDRPRGENYFVNKLRIAMLGQAHIGDDQSAESVFLVDVFDGIREAMNHSYSARMARSEEDRMRIYDSVGH